MNEKEISELRRRLRTERCGITHIRGCCVNETGEIISRFNQPLALMEQEEAETFLTLLKRILSGALGKNLIDIAFTTGQVADDEAAAEAFFRLAARGLELEGSYLILLAHDVYDVPCHSRDGMRQDDASSEVFSYILCAVCPVKPAKPALSYRMNENLFRNRTMDLLVAPPETGFLFPAFDGRSTNLYNSLLYTRDSADDRRGFVEAVFRCTPPMPAQEQKETFQSLLGEALEEECSLDVVQAVREQFCEIIEEYKQDPEAGPPVLSKGAVKSVLKSCGVSDSRVVRFDEKYDGAFGADTSLATQNLVDTRRIEVRTPDVAIQVSPERGDLLETRMIGGTKYILIRADGDVEVNGVQIHID